MKIIKTYIDIIRPGNALMAASATFLGFWLSHSAISYQFLLLSIATIAATGFGNVINDINDLDSDRISHPQRPLPQGLISLTSTWIFTFALVLVSLISSFLISSIHLFATLIPILILILYSYFFKRTPLIGNFVVASLVAYPLLFGGLNAPGFSRLIVPALLAFLLNLCREIIKDIQDTDGDRAAGYTTSASIPTTILKFIITLSTIAYFGLVFIPYLRNQFGFLYLIICSGAVLPTHIVWLTRLFSKNWKLHLTAISRFIKLEMLFGLLALAIDELFRDIFKLF